MPPHLQFANTIDITLNSWLEPLQDTLDNSMAILMAS